MPKPIMNPAGFNPVKFEVPREIKNDSTVAAPDSTAQKKGPKFTKAAIYNENDAFKLSDKKEKPSRGHTRNFLDAAFHLTTYFARRTEKQPERLTPNRIPMGDVPLFPGGDKGKIDPFDAQQGQLHDCYLFGAMRTIARNDPQAIRDAIQQQPDGSFNVRFFDKGKPEIVNVKPEFDPRYGGLPLDDKGKPKALWPAVIQQAWIQYKGQDNVEKAEYRVARTPLEALTGRKARQIASPLKMPGEEKRRFETLKEAHDKGWPTTIITMPLKEKTEQATGLHGSHTYEVKDVGIDKDGKKYIELSENHDNSVVRISPEIMAKHIVAYEMLTDKKQ